MNRIVHFELQANNVDRAKEFYEKVLGWKIVHAMTKENDGMDYWTIDTGTGPGIGGGMYKRPKKPTEKLNTYDCTILVENIDKAIEDVKSNGGKIKGKKREIPKVGWFVTAKDTEGNKFGLMQATDWKPMP